MALQRVAIPSPNYSSRGGTKVRLIVLHTAEGALSYQSLGSFFSNPSSGVSSHVGIDDTAGTVGEYVSRSGKAWTAANANPYSVQAELCAFAEWTPVEWGSHQTMLANTAAWIAEEAAAFGIPIVRLTAAQAQGGGTGVCQHVDLGSAGGGHWDCGPGFPMDQVIQMAGGSGAVAPDAPSAPAAPLPSGPAPAWPGRYLELQEPMMQGQDVATWQGQMQARGWSLDPDGWYGPHTMEVCLQFQGEKGLAADGIVGPDTWAAAWTAPIT